jgi:hypothetical protein
MHRLDLFDSRMTLTLAINRKTSSARQIAQLHLHVIAYDHIGPNEQKQTTKKKKQQKNGHVYKLTGLLL